MQADKDPLESRSLEAAMDRESLRWLSRLEIHRELDSTNRYLLARAKMGAPKGEVCLAEAQSAGKGRRERAWLSPPSGNIYLSLLWYFSSGSRSLGGLSLAAGVAVIRALRDRGVMGAGLKWPNDILWDTRKLGGILVELVPKERGVGAVIGIGINVAMPTPYRTQLDQPCVDLLEVVHGRPFDRNRLAGRLIHHLLLAMRGFESRGLSYYLDDWHRWDACYRREVYLSMDDSVIFGMACGVDEEGCLLLRGQKGISRYFCGEVSLRPTR